MVPTTDPPRRLGERPSGQPFEESLTTELVYEGRFMVKAMRGGRIRGIAYRPAGFTSRWMPWRRWCVKVWPFDSVRWYAMRASAIAAMCDYLADQND